LEYAKTLGLTSVLQDDMEAGLMIGENLAYGNFTRPLAVQLKSFDKRASEYRRLGIQNAIGRRPALLDLVESANSSSSLDKLVRDVFLQSPGAFDSIVSLGGSVSVLKSLIKRSILIPNYLQ
jgi:hypothetical protein